MSATKPKTIVVVGATGLQGRSVVESLAKSGTYHVKGITRESDHGNKAQEFKNRGIEITACDYNDVNSLAKVFQGAYGVFACMDFLLHGSEHEIELGKRVFDAAKKQGVQHYVWSSQQNCQELSGGKYAVLPFTGKFQVEKYIRDQAKESVSGTPITSFIYPAMYYEDMEHFDPLKPQFLSDKTFVFRWPIPHDIPIPFIDPEVDVGPVVEKIFAEGYRWDKAVVPIAGQNYTLMDICKIFSQVTGYPCKFELYDSQQFSSDFENKGGKDLVELFNYIKEFGYFPKGLDLSFSPLISPPTSWPDYLSKHKWWQM